MENLVNMFNNIYYKRKVLITGHTGFKGSWLATWLLNLGAEVAGYSIGIPTNPSHFVEVDLQSKIKHYLGDICDFNNFSKVCNDFKPEIIFHLAAQPLVRESYLNPRETFETNVIGTLNVLETIRLSESNIKVGIIITSDKAYDNVEWLFGYRENDRLGGEDPYSGSKGAAELVAKSYMKSFFNLANTSKIATTRAGNVIGGGDWAKDRIVPDIVKSWSHKKSVEIRYPFSTRPWQHVLEPLSGYLELAAQLFQDNIALQNSSFNFGPDSKINKNVSELIEQMMIYWKDSHGWINKSENNNSALNEANLLKLNCDKANILLKWFPVLSFHETIELTTNWYINYYNNNNNTFDLTSNQIQVYTSLAKKRGIKWAINNY